MKKIIILITVLAFWGCDKDSTGTGGGNGNNVTELEGAWIGDGWTFIFSGSAFSATDGDDEWYEATFSINTQTNPKRMDSVITDCPYSDYIGTTALAIYKIEDNILTLASNEPGATSRPTSFTEPFSNTRVFILTKQ